MLLAREENFGPVVPVFCFNSENEVVAWTSEAAPFGGVKESGHGRDGATHGLDDYMRTKGLCHSGP